MREYQRMIALGLKDIADKHIELTQPKARRAVNVTHFIDSSHCSILITPPREEWDVVKGATIYVYEDGIGFLSEFYYHNDPNMFDLLVLRLKSWIEELKRTTEDDI